MLEARCLRRASHHFSTPRNPISRHATIRNISTINLHVYHVPSNNNERPRAILRAGNISRHIKSRPFAPIALRFASTTTGIKAREWELKPMEQTPGRGTSGKEQADHIYTPKPPETPATESEPPVEPEPSIFSEDSGTFEDIFSDGQAHVEKYVGFLKDMGLDYGWGPTSFVERLLEYIVIYSGTEWWVSITLMVVAIRLAIFKLYINAQDTSARIQAIKPLTKDLDARQREAYASKDTRAMQMVQLQKKAFNQKFGINMTNIYWPLVFQIPLGFGTFRLMRGMAHLPVPGLDEGGPLWLSDLTSPDPYYLMPCFIVLMYWGSFRLGGETGNTEDMSVRMRRIFQYALPCVTGLFSIFWPVNLQMIVFLNGFFQGMQNLLFRLPGFRKLVRIQPRGIVKMVEPTEVNLGPADPPKNFREWLRHMYKTMVGRGRERMLKTKQKSPETGRTKDEVKKLRSYEEKVKREAAQRRFEAKQAAEAKAEERRQRGVLR